MRVYIIHAHNVEYHNAEPAQSSDLTAPEIPIDSLIAQALADEGIPVWLDFFPSRSFEHQVRDYMRASGLIIAVWTPRAAHSSRFQIEWDIALNLKKRILLVHVGDTQLPVLPDFCDIVHSRSLLDIPADVVKFIKSNPGYNLFVSYAREDEESARALLRLIDRSRHHAWMDRFLLEPGSEFPSEILQAIDSSDYLLLLWSKHARESRWVEREWNYAYKQAKQTIPILLDDTPLPIVLEAINSFAGMNDEQISRFLDVTSH